MKEYLITLILLTSLSTAQEVEIEMDAQADTVYVDENGQPLEELPPIEKMPEVKKFVEASYSDEAIKRGIEGTVKMELVINDSGKVDSVKIISGIHSDLDTAALKAIKKFEFSPAVAGGEAITVAIEYGYTFSLQSFVNSIQEYTNFKGRLREKGTRSPVKDGMVVVTFLDTAMDSDIKIPFSNYLKKIGSFKNQYLEDGKLVTTTDDEGYFSFQSLPACSIKVIFPITGYRTVSAIEIIENGKQIEMDYRISRNSYDEYEIVVYGKVEKTEVAKKTLSISEIKRVPGFGGDAIKVVRALPGVARPSFISGEIIIRGSGAEDTRFFLDGVKVPRLFHFGGLRSTYSSDLLSSIDMYPGGFGSRYGGAIGGIVEVKGRPAKSDRWHGKTDINLMDVGAMVEGPITENVSLQLAGRYSYIGKVIESATKNTSTSVIPIYMDGYARLDWNINKKNQAFLTYSTSTDKLEVYSSEFRGGSEEITDDTNAALAEDWFQMGLLGLNSKIFGNLNNEFRLSMVDYSGTGSFFGFEQWEYTGWEIYFRDEMQYSPSKYFKVKPGLDLSVEKWDYSLNILGAIGFASNEANPYMSTLGAYTNVEINPTKNWLVIPGIRYDYFTGIEEGMPSYRMTSRYQYIPGLTVKGSAGTYSQMPKPLGQSTDAAAGNPDLPSTKAIHYVAGHEWQISDLMSLDIQTYYNTQTDVPNFTDSVNAVTGKPYNFLPDMEARMYGMDVMLRHDQGGRFFGWISYSLSRSERRAPNAFAEGLKGNSEWNPDAWVLSQNDQTHNLQFLGSWRLPRNWETGFRLRYVTGNPTTPLKSFTENKFEYNSDYMEYSDILGEPFSDRVGPFIQLDIRVDKKFVMKNWMLSTYLDFKNVNYFFYNSPEYYEYNYDKSKREAIGAIFIPSFGITAEF